MLNNVNRLTFHGLSVTATLVAASVQMSAASAQEPILLEKIGAVRMAQPREAAARAVEATPTLHPEVRLWYTGAHAIAYYTIDKAAGELVVTIDPGPAGGEHETIRRTLIDGRVERVVLAREMYDHLVVTLAVTRTANDFQVAITSLPIQKVSTN